MTPALSLRHLSKRFKRIQALDDVSFDVPPGSVCALLGANGAGKTTAIRVLLGLERPDAGTSKVLGLDSQRYSQEIRRRVGYVPERPTLYEWMTVREIGWFAAGFYPPGYQQQYEQHARRFGLDPGQRIAELSKGTRAKVSLSLALAHSPRLLVLDEPTSGLDPLVRREFLESMVDVASAGRTVLLSSHQVHEVERVADLVVILIEGKLVCLENLDELKRSTVELVVTLPEIGTPLPSVPGTVLAHVPFGHEHVLIVRDLEEEKLPETFPPPAAYELRKPSLEEILLTLLRERRSAARAESSALRVEG
jgi:ABC-2 type transport system ATP-binding protein